MLRKLYNSWTGAPVTPQQLVQAAIDDDVNVVSRFIREHGQSISNDALAQTVSAAMGRAVIHDRASVLSLLVVAGGNINSRDQFGNPMLILAIANGREQRAKSLIEMGADVNCTDNFGNTPLMVAVMHGCTGVIDALILKGGLKVNAVNAQGRNALMLAAGFNKSLVLQTLVSMPGIAFDMVDHNGDTALARAVDKDDDESIRVLLEAGADVNIANYRGDTPLHKAVRRNSAIYWRLLEVKGIRVDARNVDGLTAREEAEQLKLYAIANVIAKVEREALLPVHGISVNNSVLNIGASVGGLFGDAQRQTTLAVEEPDESARQLMGQDSYAVQPSVTRK